MFTTGNYVLGDIEIWLAVCEYDLCCQYGYLIVKKEDQYIETLHFRHITYTSSKGLIVSKHEMMMLMMMAKFSREISLDYIS